jgi:threonine synthase
VKEIYLKDDSVNHPTLSFKDRVVAVAITKAKEFGFDTVACAATDNLANAVAALATGCNPIIRLSRRGTTSLNRLSRRL